MASKVKISLTWGQDVALLTMLDPVGLDNTWTCDPEDFLSARSGKWSQGFAALPVFLHDQSGQNTILQFDLLNMFNPENGSQSGDAISSGDAGTVGDTQVVKWTIDSIE